MLIANANANRDAGTAAPSGEAAPSGTPSAEETVSEEEMQEVLDLIRAQPRREAEDPYAVGEVDAPVVLIEYADYRCSFCGKWSLETKPGLMDQVEDGTLRIEWRDFPVFQNESVDLAVAARAAAQQGMFWEYNEAIFTYQFVDGNQDFTDEALTALAEEVGVPDLARFGEDLASEALRAEVQAEYEESLALLGQASTPQFLVNDQYIGGALPLEDFLAVIEQELAKL
ncbi:MAG: disulfide bond formation protein [Actinobacteria bacterium]|nr:disulfide bond formation protein [Actinomycetota bacterium]